MPLRKKSIPSVVMNDGHAQVRRDHAARRARRRPTTSERERDAEPERAARARPGSQSHHTSAGASAKTRPTARSISPQISSITSPAAIERDRRHRLGDVLDVVALAGRRCSAPGRRASAPTATTKMLASRRRRNAPATRQPKPARRRCVLSSLPPRPCGRYETGYFCALELPSYRVFVVRYGLTFAFVTNSRPVFVSDGATRPPDSL